MNLLKRGILLFCFFLLCITLKYYLEKHLETIPKNAPSLYEQNARYHAKSMSRSSLGFENLIAGLLWIRLLQKARHWEVEPGKVSWEFVQLDAITTLDRRNIRPYEFGAVFLSVFLRDKLGAKIILRKWVEQQPNNWKSHYHLGFHLFFEMNAYEEAAKYIIKAASLSNAPHYLTSLGIRLLSESSNLAHSLRTTLFLYPDIKDQESKERLTLRIRSLRYQLEKSLWENSLNSFRKQFQREPKDISDLNFLRQGEIRNLASMLDNTSIQNELLPLFAENYEFTYSPEVRKIVSRISIPEIELSPGIFHFKEIPEK